jgi:predicted Rdx family selenoprotein
MVEQIFDEFGWAFTVHLIPSEKGIYDVTVQDDLVYSKHETGRHAEWEEVAEKIRTYA